RQTAMKSLCLIAQASLGANSERNSTAGLLVHIFTKVQPNWRRNATKAQTEWSSRLRLLFSGSREFELGGSLDGIVPPSAGADRVPDPVTRNSIGFVSNPAAPSAAAFCLVGSSPYAVIMITGTFGRAAVTFGSISSPLMPGMLMSDRIRISMGSAIVFARS